MNYFVPSTSSSTKISDKIWMVLWVLFGLSIYTSKSGLSIFGTILLLWSFLKFDWKKAMKGNRWFLVLLSIFPVAVILSLLSIGGVGAALNVIRGWAWPLYIIPFYFLFQDKKALRFFSCSLMLGLFASCVYAFYIFATDFHWAFGTNVRVASFWDIGRWGYILSCSAVVLFALVGHESTWHKINKYEKALTGFLLILSLACLVLSNTRGPWLATGVGFFVLGVSGKRYFKMFCGAVLLGAISLFFVPGIFERVQSSFSAKKENGVITSKDASNAGRLHMWQVNLQLAKEHPFFGTGFESAEKPLRDFLEKQGPEYRAKYVNSEFSFHDQHNSYLQTYVQMGIFFFILFWGVVLVLTLFSVRDFFRNKDILVKIAFALITTQLFIFIFYSSVSSYEGLWFYPMLMVLSSVCAARRKEVYL